MSSQVTSSTVVHNLQLAVSLKIYQGTQAEWYAGRGHGGASASAVAHLGHDWSGKVSSTD